MKETTQEIKLIPIDQIRILNPRFRDQKKFALVVQSIKNLGLKKPIQVSLRNPRELAEQPGYDLVCGQGRIEAFQALGHKEIPAIVVEIPKEDRLLRSLVENMARRFPKPTDLLEEINRLKEKGYNNAEIGRKLDLTDTMVSGFLVLQNQGEERLLQAALTGRIALSIAMDIARVEGKEDQRALLKDYEEKKLDWVAIRTVKRLLAHRQYLGKKRGLQDGIKKKGTTNAEAMVKAYRREGERLKLMIRKARVCNSKLTFVIAAFKQLAVDPNYMTLLKAESLMTMPKNLYTKLAEQQPDAV